MRRNRHVRAPWTPDGDRNRRRIAVTRWEALLRDPVLQLRGSRLDHLELLLGGLYAPADGYCLPGGRPVDWPVEPTLSVPAETARAAMAQKALLLADPDGTPLARLSVTRIEDGRGPQVHVAGRLTALQPAEHPPARGLRVTARLDRPAPPAGGGGTTAGGGLVIAAFTSAPSPEQMAQAAVAARGGALVLLAVMETTGPHWEETTRLLETLQACAAHLPGARVRLLIAPTEGFSADGREVRRESLRAGYDGGGRSDTPAPAGAGPNPRSVALRRLGADVLLDFTGVAGRNLAAPGSAGEPARASTGRGLVILVTGLSGSGKSTLARDLAERLRREDPRRTVLLDGDDVRTLLSSGLGFSRQDRELNVRRIGWVAARVAEAGGIALCAPIAPFESSRREVRAMASASSDFLLVHVSTPLAVCEERDRKGLYAKARAGLIPEFTGISSPYEEPSDADVVVDLAQLSVAEGTTRLLDAVRRLG